MRLRRKREEPVPEGPLLAVPNVSVGPEPSVLEPLTAAFTPVPEIALLDRHTDAVHGRSVLTLAAPVAALGPALLLGARAAIELIDLRSHAGAHPHIGALDVCPVVYPDPAQREQAESLARDLAALLGELGLPVFLYGALASSEERRERHFFRKGGIEALRERMAEGLAPDFGPAEPHPSAGATLVTARPPLAAFNVELEGADLEAGRAIAAELREAGGGLSGVRALAIDLGEGRIQISTNVHDPIAVTLSRVVAEIARLAAPHGARPAIAELIGVIPAAALEDYPAEVPIADPDPALRTIEACLEQAALPGGDAGPEQPAR